MILRKNIFWVICAKMKINQNGRSEKMYMFGGFSEFLNIEIEKRIFDQEKTIEELKKKIKEKDAQIFKLEKNNFDLQTTIYNVCYPIDPGYKRQKEQNKPIEKLDKALHYNVVDKLNEVIDKVNSLSKG
jgi:predicted RNase H-like nuclease (RuvC/YqgF family)